MGNVKKKGMGEWGILWTGINGWRERGIWFKASEEPQ
jgi:hypothetical protein